MKTLLTLAYFSLALICGACFIAFAVVAGINVCAAFPGWCYCPPGMAVPSAWWAVPFFLVAVALINPVFTLLIKATDL